MKSFADLFRGREDAYGTYADVTHTQANEVGKRVGRAQTVTRANSPDLFKDDPFPRLYQEHLEGKRRLGIPPCLPNSKCWWFCIDVDFYQEVGLYTDIAQRIKETGLPLVMTKSKSGGIHLWCFFSEQISAAKAREMAISFRKKLKLPDKHVDIFPAQEKTGSDSVGNWVNIPYFGDACHCLGEDGEHDLTLQEFLVYANEHLQHPADLEVKSAEKVSARKSGAPPCIDWMKENGVPEGYRGNAMTHFAIYARKAHGEDGWEEIAREFNDEHCQPPMDKYELKTTINSVRAHPNYAYLCNKIKPLYCDVKECKLREYGVGGGNPDVAIMIERIEKIDGEEPVYRITIDGKRFQVSLDQLYLYNSFKKAALGAINRFLPPLKQAEWEEYMSDVLQEMEVQEAAADTQMKDRVLSCFRLFAENSTITDTTLKNAYTLGNAFFDGDKIIFQGEEFMKHVDRQLNRLPREKTWAYMRDDGTTLVEYKIDNVKVKFWAWVLDGRKLWFEPKKGKQA